MEFLDDNEKAELLQLAIQKASDHIDDLYTKVYEYLQDIIGLDWNISDNELRSIALEACRQVEKKQAAAVERSENNV